MARPRSMTVYFYKRTGSKIWWMRYRDRGRQTVPGNNQHRRLARSAAEAAGTFTGQRSKHPANRSQR